MEVLEFPLELIDLLLVAEVLEDEEVKEQADGDEGHRPAGGDPGDGAGGKQDV